MTSEYRHIPVLLEECMRELELGNKEVFVDATLGFAGHSVEAARLLGPDSMLIGIDQDDEAIASATERLMAIPEDSRPEINILHCNFGSLD